MINFFTKILNLLGQAFVWLSSQSQMRRAQRREDEIYRRQAIDELRRSNDEMIVRIAELYKEVLESRKEIMLLQTENEKLSVQVQLLTEQNATLINEINSRNNRRKKKSVNI